MTAFATALWIFVLIPLALAAIVCFLWRTSKRHCPVTDPDEQREMVERFREAGG